MGTYQVGTSLARVLGPFGAGLIFGRCGPETPFLAGARVRLQAAWRVLVARRTEQIGETA